MRILDFAQQLLGDGANHRIGIHRYLPAWNIWFLLTEISLPLPVKQPDSYGIPGFLVAMFSVVTQLAGFQAIAQGVASD